MNVATVINAAESTIDSPKDVSVRRLEFYENKKISFLPEKVAESFPNLVYYDARDCSIKSISKNNFGLLSLLEILYLADNQIEQIPNNTFQDLTSLAELRLGDMKV